MANFTLFRNMALSFNLGGGMTRSQKEWLINWVKSNISTPAEFDKVATIAWQYELPEDVIETIKNLKPEDDEYIDNF